jgi:uncharacterized OsmC-like protein
METDMTDTATTTRRTNGLDLDALDQVVASIQADPGNAMVAFKVTTDWQGQTRSRSSVDSYVIGGNTVPRSFMIDADEPDELLGANGAPNPQELLMSAINACMMVGYVAQASVRGITLESCRIETRGELDLRGFLGLADDVPAGYRQLDYRVRIKGDGTPAQYEDIHQAVMKTSPNYFNLARPIRMNGVLEIGD